MLLEGSNRFGRRHLKLLLVLKLHQVELGLELVELFADVVFFEFDSRD